MFEDSGSKVKTVGKVFFLVLLICLFVYGVVSCRSVSAISGKKVSGMGFLSFLLIADIGSLSAWISGVMVHAFGEMVENTGHISCIELEAEKLRKSQERLEKNVEQMKKNIEKMEEDLQQKLTPELSSQTITDITGAVRICRSVIPQIKRRIGTAANAISSWAMMWRRSNGSNLRPRSRSPWSATRSAPSAKRTTPPITSIASIVANG